MGAVATKSGVRVWHKEWNTIWRFGGLVHGNRQKHKHAHTETCTTHLSEKMQEFKGAADWTFIVSVRIHLVCGGRPLQEQLGCLDASVLDVVIRPLAPNQQSRCMVATC